MYKFVKIKDNRTGVEYPYMMECCDIADLITHTEKYQASTIEAGVIDFLRAGNQHATTAWRSACEVIAGCHGKTFIDESVSLENKVYGGKLKAILNFGSVLLRESGSYMCYPSDFEILSVVESIELSYPNVDVSVRYLQWINAGHYYAKVGNVDVVDSDGNQKWNTRKEAEQAVCGYAKKNGLNIIKSTNN